MAKSVITLEQKRAQHAYQCIERAKSREKPDDYGRVCVRLPALIRNNGLCQAVAFLEAKAGSGKQHFKAVLDDLARMIGGFGNNEPGEKLAQKAREAPVGEYQRLMTEAIACANWLKRYAEAILKVSREETT